ncbi:MAG TPA: response regulator [Candidatus Obscuribacterales bacterium]
MGHHEPIPIHPLVLVVEDSPVIRQIAAKNLDKFLVDAEYAADGKEALQLFTKKRYSLVLMDIHMPEMDGLEATKRMREAEKGTGRHTPIIAITASDTKAHCLEAGMDDYVTKPADYSRVIHHWLPTVRLKTA